MAVSSNKKTKTILVSGISYNFVAKYKRYIMKKSILFTMLLVMGYANAQDSESQVVGVKLGFNSTNFSGDINADDRKAFFAGITVDYAISEKFHVQPEFLYSQEGAKDANLDYFRVPILLKYYLVEGLHIQAGPEVAFRLDAESDVFEDNTSTFDYGVGFGGGYELKNGIAFDVRYNLGLSDISKVKGAELKNKGFQIGIGYRFN